jgi:hypothetical protein
MIIIKLFYLHLTNLAQTNKIDIAPVPWRMNFKKARNAFPLYFIVLVLGGLLRLWVV